MLYYGGKLCINVKELTDCGVSEVNYDNLQKRGQIRLVRRGGGKGCCALIDVESLPYKYKEMVEKKYPGGASVILEGYVMEHYSMDQNAVAFYSDKAKTGAQLSAQKIKEYSINAGVLNCCIQLYNNAAAAQKVFGGKYSWEKMSAAINILREKTGHTLPESNLRFRKKAVEYQREGYKALISGKFGNQSARKVDYKTERLILGLATLPNKPFNTSVAEMYNMFVCGELDCYDPETGEVFCPDDFADKKGNPKTLSETTISNILNAPKNRVLIEHRLSSWTTFMHEQKPYMHRHAPEFSFSKISFDDRDLPRKLKDTHIRPKAYYAYDVASQCVVGYAYNRYKNVDLVVDMFRNMFRMIDRNGWMCPAQVEVENHLMSQWKDSFLKAGEMFPFVRFCAPQNSQEKFAEAMNGAKKRSIEHKNHLGIGRFYAKTRQYRTEAVKVFDSYNDTYEDKQYYTWDELIADDIRDIEEFNNSLHPNQKKYPGMTRLDVLRNNMNPTLQPVNKAVLAKYIGEKVETSVRRNSYCRVAHQEWWLSDTKVLSMLAPNNYKVTAYYLTDDNGEPTDVYIYQDGNLIDRLDKIQTFNTAAAEETEDDKAAFVEQRKKIAKFDAYVKENEIAAVGVSEKADNSQLTIDNSQLTIDNDPPPEEYLDENSPNDYLSEDYAARALADF
jgi:hypothetical protein